MTSTQLSPQIGRIILGQLETPKRESQLEIEGYKPWDAFDRQRITLFLDTLASKNYVARETPPPGIRTPGAWKATTAGREAMTRGDFLADGDA
jgi:hypothetical protein